MKRFIIRTAVKYRRLRKMSSLNSLLQLIFIFVLTYNLYHQPLRWVCESSYARLRTELALRRPQCTSRHTRHSPSTLTHLRKSIQVVKQNSSQIYNLSQNCTKIKNSSLKLNLCPLSNFTFEKLTNIKLDKLTNLITNFTNTQNKLFMNVTKLHKLVTFTFRKLKYDLPSKKLEKNKIVYSNLISKLTNYSLEFKRFALSSIRFSEIEKAAKFYNQCMSALEPLDIYDLKLFLYKRNESREAIFFIETSSTGKIDSKFVCTVESAARVHPNTDIYLVMADLPNRGLTICENEPLFQILKFYTNVYVLGLKTKTFFENSVLEKFYTSGKLTFSSYKKAHTADVLRVLLLYMYGGKYFDLDIVFVNSLEGITNFVIHESQEQDTNFANGAFGFSKFHPVGKYMIDSLNEKFVANSWDKNGPVLFTEAMQNFTGIKNVRKMSKSKLKGFKKFKHETLFPVHEYMWFYAENEELGGRVLEGMGRVRGLWGVHTFNNMAHVDRIWGKVRVGTGQGYSLLGEKFCPRTYWSCYQYF